MKASRLSLPLLLILVSTPIGIRAQRWAVRGATIVDGSGGQPFRGDVLIDGDRIVSVGDAGGIAPDRTIDGRGLVLAPGFIDVHSHSRKGLIEDGLAPTQLSQGITTLVVGADGSAPFPTGEYRAGLRSSGTSVNVGLLAGHGTIRRLVMGDDYKRPALDDEIEAMIGLVRLAMRQGAMGLSTGLEYDPGFYSTTEELVRVAREAAAHGGFYMSHIRDEEEGFIKALQEAVEIGRRARVRVQISHIKLGNTRVWGQTEAAFEIIAKARAEGIEIGADCYPYAAWANGLAILVPSRRFEDRDEIAEAFDKIGGAANVLITRFPPDKSYQFKTIPEISGATGTSEIDVFIDLMKRGGAGIVGMSMNPDDVDRFYQHPLVMVGSDGGTDSRHPRMSGTFPRVLGRYVRERGILSLQSAVHKMTAMPARLLGLGDRGLIRESYRADLVLFDPAKVIDRSDFQNPHTLSEGIERVWVNGVEVWSQGRTTGMKPGRMLIRP